MNNESNDPSGFDENEEQMIRDSFSKLDKRLGITAYTPDHLKKSFEKKLLLATAKRSLFATWRGLWASILAAFSIGVLLTRFAMMPATIATRGGPESGVGAPDSPSRIVSIATGNPEEFAFKVISLALNAEMEVTSQKSGEKIVLYIKPFKQGSAEQASIKLALGLDSEAAGSISAIITKDPKK